MALVESERDGGRETEADRDAPQRAGEPGESGATLPAGFEDAHLVRLSARIPAPVTSVTAGAAVFLLLRVPSLEGRGRLVRPPAPRLGLPRASTARLTQEGHRVARETTRCDDVDAVLVW